MDREAYATTFRQEQSYWWFTGRLAILRRVVDRVLAGRRNLEILNLGCGTGATSEAFAGLGRVVSADRSPEALAFCRARGMADVVEADAEALGFPDATFDLVLALDVVEHLEKDAAGLAEIRRVLRPGGVAVITVPAFGWLWSRMDEIAWHRRRYRRSELVERVRAAGLTVQWTSYFNTLLFPLGMLERGWERLTRPRRDRDIFLPGMPGWLNTVLSRIFAAEAPLLDRLRFPFGMSVLVVAGRPS